MQVGISVASQAQSAELSKGEAGKILAYMGCKPNKVVAVVQGVGAASGPNAALVIATCLEEGKPNSRKETFLYDNDLGWFFFKMNRHAGTVRVWSNSGFRQFEPPAP